MTLSLLQQAFGKDSPDLYEDVLKCPKSSSMAQLRKAYYRRALQYHPDKQQQQKDESQLKFQAVSWAYQYLKDPDRRKDYDEEGILPHDDDIDDNDDENGSDAWKSYFDQLFGKVKLQDIDEFAAKYKMSPEEEQDVLKYYQQFEGNLQKVLGFVLLSEDRDVSRWVEDYLQPAIDAKQVADYSKAMQKSLAAIQKRMEKGLKEGDDEEFVGDPDETETEEEDNKVQQAKSRKKPPPKKKASKPRKKKEASSEMDLIAAIRNKNRGGTNPLASLASRYGVSMPDDDPLDDAAFSSIQSKLDQNKRRRKK